MRDHRGDPIDDLRVAGQVRRPTHEGFDRDVTLARRGSGLYAVELTLPLLGQWDVRLTARTGDGRQHRMEQRLWLK